MTAISAKAELQEFKDKYGTIKDVCIALSTEHRKFDHQSIRHLVNTNQIAHTKIGKIIYIEWESIRTYLKNKYQPAKKIIKPDYESVLKQFK